MNLGLQAPGAKPSAGARREGLKPCVFVDMDGTLVESIPYNVDPALLRWRPGAGEALARLQRAGLAVVIVTNQSGLAQGLFSRAAFARLQGQLLLRLQQEFGLQVMDVEVCPHAPDAQGRPACLCRKPAAGMLVSAAQRHRLDMGCAWMVGDTLDDVEAGRRAGIRSLLYDSGGETLWRQTPLRRPDAVFCDWSALAQHVLQELADAAIPYLQQRGAR